MISSLRETVRAREAELITLRDETESDVHHMPRRVLAEHESVWDEIPGADELWTDGSHPTVVDLRHDRPVDGAAELRGRPQARLDEPHPPAPLTARRHFAKVDQ